MKKRCQRGPQKSCFWVQIGDMGFPVSTYHLIFDVLVRCQKIIIFGRLPDGPTNRKKRTLGRQGPQKVPRVLSGVVTFGIGGRGAPRARYYKTIKQQAVGARSATPMADGQANLYIYIFMYI